MTFRPGSHKGEKEINLEKAIELAQCGELEEIRFPLTYEEQQVKRMNGLQALDEAFDSMINDRDTNRLHTELIFCSKPVILARQAAPKPVNGHLLGGYLRTEDGEEFHQSDAKKLLERRGAGTIVVLDYDEAREPWYKTTNRKEH